MTDTENTSESGAMPLREIPILRTQGLFAEYTTGRAPSGEWFALGTVRSETPLPSPPAWILVGTGHSARRTQSGGVQRFLLPNTGLALWVPRFILAPPNGAPRNVLLAPSEIKAPTCLAE